LQDINKNEALNESKEILVRQWIKMGIHSFTNKDQTLQH